MGNDTLTLATETDDGGESDPKTNDKTMKV